MAAAIVTIICIAMIVVGGMTLSQGILTSTDSTATSIEAISVREGEIMRTNLEILRAAQLSWGDYFRITVQNTGQTKLATFDKWDLIASYEGDDGVFYSTWFPYSTNAVLTGDEWRKARIGLSGPTEYFEPGILNPGEEMVVLACFDPLSGSNTTGEVSLTAPNGVFNSMSFVNPGYLRLTPQSENIFLSGTKYYELVEAATADGLAITLRTQFNGNEGGRQLLYCTEEPAREARFIYPLVGVSQIPAGQWTVSYYGYVSPVAESGSFPREDGDVNFNIDILIRKADGILRATLATSVAPGWVSESDQKSWKLFAGIYDFPGYTVVDEDDYLEIVYYGQTTQGPAESAGYMQISVDDSNVSIPNQTRIEAN